MSVDPNKALDFKKTFEQATTGKTIPDKNQPVKDQQPIDFKKTFDEALKKKDDSQTSQTSTENVPVAGATSGVVLGVQQSVNKEKPTNFFDDIKTSLKKGSDLNFESKLSTATLTQEDIKNYKASSPDKYLELAKQNFPTSGDAFLKSDVAAQMLSDNLNKKAKEQNIIQAKNQDAAYYKNLDNAITTTAAPVNQFLETAGIPFKIAPTKDVQQSKNQLQLLTEADRKNIEQINSDKVVNGKKPIITPEGVQLISTPFDVTKMTQDEIEKTKTYDENLYNQLIAAQQKVQQGYQVASVLHKAINPVQTQLGTNMVTQAKNNPLPDPNKNGNDDVRKIGEEIFKLKDPERYALYQKAGGYDHTVPYAEQTFNNDLDQVNKEIMTLGYAALKGDVAANGTVNQYANIYDNLKYLDYKFSTPKEEETKHMIAAALKAKGITPSSASDEEKDDIARTLPLENQQVWFNKAKQINNVDLPDTGFWYSAGTSLKNTVTNALKSGSPLSPLALSTLFLGTPDDKELAQEVLRDQMKSSVLGENPESLQKYQELKQKEEDKTITAPELTELNNLSKYTNLRSDWDKFKDGSANMVGMVAGVTVDALPYLGANLLSRGLIKGTEALVAEQTASKGFSEIPLLENTTKSFAERLNIPRDAQSILNFAKNKNEMYIIMHHDNAKRAMELFPDDDTKKAWYTGITDVLSLALPNLLPTHKLGALFNTETKGIVADLVSKITEKNLDNAAITDLLKETATKIIGKAGTFVLGTEKTAAETALTMSLLNLGNDITKAILKPGSINGGDISNNFIQTFSSTFLDSQLIGLIGGHGEVQKRYGQVGIDAIYDASNNKNSSNAVKYAINDQLSKGDLTPDQAGEKTSILNAASIIRPQVDELQKQEDLSTSQAKRVFVNLLNERILSNKIETIKKAKASETLISSIEDRIKEIADVNKKIIGREVTVDDNYSVIDKPKEPITKTEEKPKDAIQLLNEARDNGKLGVFNNMDDEAVLKMIAQQAQNLDDKGNSYEGTDAVERGKMALDGTNNQFGEDLVKAAIVKYPAEKNIPKKKDDVSANPLKDVESTAKALDDLVKSGTTKAMPLGLGETEGVTPQSVSEAYHKAKENGSNPELVKAVEDVLATPEEKKQEISSATESGIKIEDVHTSAKNAGIDINTDEFKTKSKELTGEEHLDNMTPEQLEKMNEFIKSEKVSPGIESAKNKLAAFKEKYLSPAPEEKPAVKTEDNEKINQLQHIAAIEDKAQDAEHNQDPAKAAEVVKIVDEEIKSTPEQQARDNGEKTVDGQTIKRQDPVKAVIGNPVDILFSKDEKQAANYAVIEREELQPSHKNGIKNEMHFIPEAQPRDRGALEVLKNEAKKKSDSLDPNQLAENNIAYFGSPIVNTRGEVIQGNGRAEAIDYYYNNNKDDSKGYRAMIENKVSSLGLDADAISKMKEPVLVRMADVNDEDAIILGNHTSSDLEDVKQKNADAKAAIGKLKQADLVQLSNIIGGKIGENDTLKSAIRENAKPILDLLMEKGILRGDNREQYFNKDGVTPEGIEAAHNVVKQLLFEGGENDLSGKFDSLPFSQREAIEKTIPSILSNRELKIHVQKAIEILHDKQTESAAENFNTWAKQFDMFKGGKSALDVYDKSDLALAKKIDESKTQKEISTAIKQLASDMNDKPAELFEPEKKAIPFEKAMEKNNISFAVDESNSQDVADMKDIVKDLVEGGDNNLSDIQNIVAHELDDDSPEMKNLVESAYHEYGKDPSSTDKDVTMGVIGKVGKFLSKLFGGKTTDKVFISLNEESLMRKAEELEKEGGQPMFMKSPKGKILGFTHDSKIYLNGEQLNPNTPIHEAGHIWTEWAKQNDERVYNRGIELVIGSSYLDKAKGSKFYKAEANKLPEDQREQYYQHEALAMAIGDKGAQFITEAKKAGFKEWLKNLWNNIKEAAGFKNITPNQLQKLSLEEFAKRASKEILSGEGNATEKITGLRKSILNREHIQPEIQAGIDNSVREHEDVWNEVLAEARNGTFDPTEFRNSILDRIDKGEKVAATDTMSFKLLFDRKNIQNEMSILKKQLEKAYLDGNSELQSDIAAQMQHQEEQLDLNRRAVRGIGKEGGRGISALQAITNLDDLQLLKWTDELKKMYGVENDDAIPASAKKFVEELNKNYNEKLDQLNSHIEKLKQDAADAKFANDKKQKSTPADINKKTLSQSGKEIADRIRKLKSSKDTLQTDITLGLRDLAVEAVAQLVEQGTKIADAIIEVLKDDKFKVFTEDDLTNHILKGFKKEDLVDKIKEISLKNKDASITKDTVKPLRNLIKEYTKDKLYTDLDSVIKAVMGDLKDVLPDLTERQVRDAYSGYGMNPETKNEVKTGYEKFKAQSKKVSEYEDAVDKLKELQETPSRNVAEQEKLVKKINSLLDDVKGYMQQQGIPVSQLSEPTEQQKSISALNETLEKRVAEKKEKLDANDFSEGDTPPKDIYKDATTQKLQSELNQLNKQFNARKHSFEFYNRGFISKLLQTGAHLKRAFVLSHITTLAKLGAALTENIVINPLRELTGGAFYGTNRLIDWALQKGLDIKNPVYHDLILKADRQGVPSWAAESAAWKSLGKGGKAWEDFISEIKNGYSEIGLMYGRDVYPDAPKEFKEFWYKLNSILDYPGRTHAAIKSIPKRTEFERSYVLRKESAIRNGLNVNDPVIQAKIAEASYDDATASILMKDNLVSKAWSNLIKKGWKSDNLIAQGFSFIGSELMPIVKVPTNLVLEAGRYTIGGHGAAIRIVFGIIADALNHGLDKAGATKAADFFAKGGLHKLTPEQADNILNNLKKGGLAFALSALAAAVPGAVQVSPFYHKGIKPPDGLDQDEIKIWGLKIPKIFQDHPLFLSMRAKATAEALYDYYRKIHKNESTIESGYYAAVGTIKGLAHETPFMQNTASIINLLERPDSKETDSFIGNFIKSTVDPGIIQDIAKMSDSQNWYDAFIGKENKRVTKTNLDYIKSGIPGLRQELPLKNKPMY